MSRPRSPSLILALQKEIKMNLNLEWFLTYGKTSTDERTRLNVTQQGFINFAKSTATDEEKTYIDDCVFFQQNKLWEPATEAQS